MRKNRKLLHVIPTTIRTSGYKDAEEQKTNTCDTCYYQILWILDDEMSHKDAEEQKTEGARGTHKI